MAERSFEDIRSCLYDALRAKFPGSDTEGYCWIENVYPDEVIYHQGGKICQSSYAISDTSDEVKLGDPVEVAKKVSYKPVFAISRDFSVTFSEDAGDLVLKRGKVFEAGDYPDKGVGFTEGDLDEAVKDFAPVENDLEHESTVLDGQLGGLQKVWRVGRELFGEVAVPKWLDKLMGDGPLKVSLAFDRNKRIVGNAIVLRPRIADAAVFAAFADHSRPGSGKGASKDMAKKKIRLGDFVKTFFGLDKVDPDTEVEVEDTETEPKKETPPATAPAVAPTTKTEGDPEFKAELDKLKADQAVFFAVSVKNASYVFADEIIRSRKALPSQREHIAGLYVKANGSDANGGPTFSAAGPVEGDAVASLRAFFKDAPAHNLTEEQLASGVHMFAGSGEPDGDEGGSGKTGGMDPRKKKRLLNATSVGASALKAKEGK